jgi:hypothetical protein
MTCNQPIRTKYFLNACIPHLHSIPGAVAPEISLYKPDLPSGAYFLFSEGSSLVCKMLFEVKLPFQSEILS